MTPPQTTRGEGLISCVHEAQRQHAQIAMMCCGKLPMTADPHWFGVFFEDANVYHIEIEDAWPGPRVWLKVGDLPLDCWPALTIERAEKCAAQLAFRTPTPDAKEREDD